MNSQFLDLLMVFPSGGDVVNTRFNYHIGSAYIIAYLRENGFSADQFISSELHNVDECAKRILKLNPKIIGFTVYEKNYMQCVLISNQLKYYKSDIMIIFGGPTPTTQSKEIIESNRSVDICVRREGEDTVLKLLHLLSEFDYNVNQIDFHEINGITFRNSRGTIITPENNVLFSNRLVKNYLDKYPSPYLTNVIPVSKAHPIGIITARGCNQNCIYCNCAILSKRNLYFHSIERVIEELSLISEYKEFEGPIPIYDDGFTIIPERAKKICEAILENDIKLSLLCATRCDKISKELLDLMKEAGFESVGFSLESAVPKVLRAVGKVTPPSNLNTGFEKEIEFINKLKEMTSYAKKIGFKSVFVSIMIGLPGESPHDAQKTIDFLGNLNIDVYAHNILHIYKGTPIYQNKEKYGYNVNSIGSNNNVILKNTFPFDVKKIRYGEKSAKIVESRNIDYSTLKTLSLKSRRESLKSFFEDVVINTNLIKPNLVKWLQKNLAINGAIIHLYTNKKELVNLQEENIKTLYDNYSPTMNYETYYWSNLNNKSILKSGRMIHYGERIGIPLNFRNTSSTLKDYYEGYNNVSNFICQDQEINDTKALYNLLKEISNSKNMFRFLSEMNFLPHFQNLCRWTQDQANCVKMKTAIIDQDDNIRICWYSDPIGTIKSSFLDLQQNLQTLTREAIASRSCNQCLQNSTCLKCVFPRPLSYEDYCIYKKRFNTWEPANMINIFYTLKDMFKNPVYLIDY